MPARGKQMAFARDWIRPGVISRRPQETAINAAGLTPDRRNQSKNLQRRHILTSSFLPSLLRASRFSRHSRTERDKRERERETCQKNLIHTLGGDVVPDGKIIFSKGPRELVYLGNRVSSDVTAVVISDRCSSLRRPSSRLSRRGSPNSILTQESCLARRAMRFSFLNCSVSR